MVRRGMVRLCAALCVLSLGALAGMAADEVRPARSRRGRTPAVHKEYKAVEVKDGGTIEGAVLFKDKAPAPEKINIVKDQSTCHVHPAERPRIAVNDEGQVKEAVVFLNLREGKPLPEKEKTARVDQKGCEFVPHVQVLHVGQPLEITNSDEVLHNIQASQSLRTVFNHIQPRKDMKQEEQFKGVGLVSFECQAHNWMKAWAYVLPHPYHAVTGEDGAFKLTDVPPGEHELHVWQEHLGEQVFEVKVEAGKTAKVEVELKASRSRRR